MKPLREEDVEPGMKVLVWKDYLQSFVPCTTWRKGSLCVKDTKGNLIMVDPERTFIDTKTNRAMMFLKDEDIIDEKSLFYR